MYTAKQLFDLFDQDTSRLVFIYDGMLK